MWGGGVCWQFPGESPHQEQYPGHNHQSPARWGRRPTLNPVHYAAVSTMRLAIVKERASLAVCEIKTTALSRKCGQHFDNRSAAMRSTFQQVFLTFRPHRRTFHMCDVLGVDSKAQHSHRQLICGWNVEYAVEAQEEDCFCTSTSCYRLSGWVIMSTSFMLIFSFNWFLFGSWMNDGWMNGDKRVKNSLYTHLRLCGEM